MLATRLREQFPDRQKGWDINVVGLQSDIVGKVRAPIGIACGAVCFVLLSLLLAGLGGLVGVLLSAWGVAALVRANPDLPRLDTIGLDARALGFALFATGLTACLVGIGPALAASGRPLGRWLSHRGAVSDRGATPARRGLVGVQVALSVVLLMGTGVLVRSLMNRLRIDLGIDAANVLTAQVSLPSTRFPKAEQRSAILEGLLTRVAAMPGVAAASAPSLIVSGLGPAPARSRATAGGQRPIRPP